MSKVRIQDDLYNYVNEKTLEQLIIPDDKPCAGGFMVLSDDVEKTMMDEFEQMCKSSSYPNDYLKRACTLYKIAMDTKKKDEFGITPVLKNLKVLDELNSKDDLNKLFKTFMLKGLPLPFKVMVETDMKNTKKHCVCLQGPSVILPDASYYKPQMAAQKEMILGIWTNIAKMIIAKTDLSLEEQEEYLADTLAFDAILGGLVKTSEEWSDYVLMYNPMESNKVSSMLNTVDFEYILNDLFNYVPDTVVVFEPRYIENFSNVFNEETFKLYKHWVYVTTVINSCSLLSEELRELGGMYYRTIAGIKAGTPIEKFAYQLASNTYSEPIGLYYGEKYFGQEAKKDITEIVYQIIDTYKSRILNNDILEESTKQKAILKLSTMGVKMGYPDKVLPIYDKLVFDEEASLYDIMHELSKIKVLDELSKINEPTNPARWAMPGHMVNACYDPFVNDITFPAAILQAPFYSLKQTRSENLGGIGAVIGHEISHAFDSNGAKCDENGNINNWWSKKDVKKFNKKVEAMVQQFDGLELPWGKVNGRFIVSENMADNGGMAVTLQIMSYTKGANYEEYFKNWARVWCSKAKAEYSALLLNVDVHGPAILRANITPRNFEEWYDTFAVSKKDQMYIAPSKRVIIW